MAPCKMFVITVCAVAAAVAVSAALAQTKEEWREAKEGEGASPKLVLEQSYHGTVPGTGNALPRVEEIKGKPGNWITWPGFLMRPDGGSRLFIQTTKALAFEKVAKKGRVQLQFKDTRVHLDNNRNPLVTVNFNTPLKTAFLKRHLKRVDLVMELKEPAEVVVTQHVDPDGYCYLFVDFPPGQYSTGGEWHPQPLIQQSGTTSSDDYLMGLPAVPPPQPGEDGEVPPGSEKGGGRAAPSANGTGGAADTGAPGNANAGGGDEDAEPPAEAPDSEIFPAT
jgi:hypothetical protein